MVVLDELTPQGFLGQGVSLLATSFNLLRCHVGELCHRVLDVVCNLRIVVVRAVDDFHTILQFTIVSELLVCPKTETSEVGRNAGHLEGHSLQWRISPRLVIGRINTEVVAKHNTDSTEGR